MRKSPQSGSLMELGTARAGKRKRGNSISCKAARLQWCNNRKSVYIQSDRHASLKARLCPILAKLLRQSLLSCRRARFCLRLTFSCHMCDVPSSEQFQKASYKALINTSGRSSVFFHHSRFISVVFLSDSPPALVHER